MSGLRNFIASTLNPWSKIGFVNSLKGKPEILDVGCGNDAVVRIKHINPDCRYTGIDIGDYNLSESSKSLIDEYVIVAPNAFAEGISSLGTRFDAVISAHNLEHVNDREATLQAMMRVTKLGGRVHIAFPCEESVNFPRRGGTLNYFDDATHQGLPPKFDEVVATLTRNGFAIDFAEKRYRPLALRIMGLLVEPISRRRNRVLKGTWALYGFESVVCATRIADANDAVDTRREPA